MFLLLLSCSGCAALLPREKEQINNLPFAHIQDAKAAYDSITPGRTTLSQLKKMRFVFLEWPGAKTIDYIGSRDMFVSPNQNITLEKLPDGARECIETRGTCETEAFPFSKMFSNEVGNFFLNKTGIKETVHTTGSEGLFVFTYAPCKDILKEDLPKIPACVKDPNETVVLYKRLTDYVPNKDTTKNKDDPFGLFSNIGGMVIGAGRGFARF